MFYKSKFIVILLLGSMLMLSGCDDAGSVSLEEALTAVESSDGTEADIAGTDDISPDEDTLLYVYVCGAVAEPGVYTLQPDSRIVAAIEAAGGFLPEAATEAINLAELVQDGMQIVVPDVGEAATREAEALRQEAGMVNLNTATVAELCTLSGIGETKAEAILAYRTEIGGFSSIEQLKEVTGIGESLYNQMKGSIYIE